VSSRPLARAAQLNRGALGCCVASVSRPLMPRTVRFAILLIGSALACDVIGAVVFGPRRADDAALRVVIIVGIYGGLLYGIARRRNWARLIFASLFAVALPFSVLAMTQYARNAPRSIAVSVVLTFLQGTGLVCLFLPSAAAWYHGRDAAA
jgi:hypothetical protein